LLHTIIVSFVLFVGCMNNVFSASEQFLKHEQLKKDFKLSSFMSLPPDPQYDVLEFLQSDVQEFNRLVEALSVEILDVDDIKTALVAEFFYNHAQIYNKKLKENQGITNYFISQEPSSLCKMIEYELINIAVMTDNPDYVSFLINLGVDINETKSLVQAFYEGKYAALIPSIESGAQFTDLYFVEPLHDLACSHREDTIDARCKVAKALIVAGIDINKVSKGVGCTALHYAAQYRNVPLVNLLLEHGARVDITDECGQTVLDSVDDSSDDDTDDQRYYSKKYTKKTIKSLLQEAQCQQHLAEQIDTEQDDDLGSFCSIS